MFRINKYLTTLRKASPLIVVALALFFGLGGFMVFNPLMSGKGIATDDLSPVAPVISEQQEATTATFAPAKDSGTRLPLKTIRRDETSSHQRPLQAASASADQDRESDKGEVRTPQNIEELDQAFLQFLSGDSLSTEAVLKGIADASTTSAGMTVGGTTNRTSPHDKWLQRQGREKEKIPEKRFL